MAGREFSFPTPADHTAHESVQAAASFLVEHPEVLPNGANPPNPTQRAVLAIEIHGAFLRQADESGGTIAFDPDPHTVKVDLIRRLRPRDTPR